MIDYTKYEKMAFLMAISVIILTLIVIGTARAESGNLEIFAENVTEYHPLNVLSGKTPLFTTLAIDITNYNRINSLYVNYSGKFTFVKESDSTTFTVSSGAVGTCNGVVSYSRSSGAINYLFSGGCEINAGTLVLTLTNTSFFSGVGTSDTPVNWRARAAAPDLSAPAFIKTTDGNYITANGDMWYILSSTTHVLNTYDVSYVGSIATVNIGKTGAIVSTKVNITNSTTLKLYETTFNANSYNTSFTYDTGIALNMTDQQGHYDFVVVNSTAYTGAGAPTGENQPGDNVLNGIGMVWEFNTYTLGETGNLSWSKTTPDLNCDVIRIYNPSGGEVYAINDPSDFGYYKTSLGINGLWKAEYRRKICLIGQESILNTAYTNVSSEQPSYIISSSPQASGIAFNATYSFGYTPPAQGELNSITIEKLNGDVWQQVNAVSLNNNAIVANAEYNKSITLGDIGKFRLRLFELSRGYVAYVIVDSIFVEIPTQKNITTSIIEVDKYEYLTGDPISIYYAIDNTNYSNYYSKYISIIHASGSYPETSHIVITQQEDTINYVSGALQTAKQGVNYVRLRAKNNTADIIITNTSFNISFIDASGYGLDVVDPDVCKGEQIIIKYSTPSTSTLRVNTISQDNLIVKYYEISINGSGSVSLKLTKSTDYQVLIYEGNLGNVRKFTTAKAENCAAAATPSATGGTAMQAQTDNFLSSGMFIVLIILLLFAGAGLHFGGFGGAVIGFGAGFIFCAIYNLVPLWSLFLFAILVITAFAIFMGDKFTFGGGGDN